MVLKDIVMASGKTTQDAAHCSERPFTYVILGI